MQRNGFYDKNTLKRSNRWDDHFTRRAKRERWLARSVFKLIELDKKYKLIKKGDKLLDLGCYPGSWSQYGIDTVGPRGHIAGIDLVPPDQILSPIFRFIQADVCLIQVDSLLQQIGHRDVVMSDLAPKTTGNKTTDTSRSMLLAERALDISLALLKKDGNFICKVFEGECLKAFRETVSKHYKQNRLFRPQAVRKRSKEVYVVGMGRIQ